MDLLIEISNVPVVESLLFLFFTSEQGKKLDWTNSLIKDYYLDFHNLKEQGNAVEFINWVLKDDFKKENLEDKNLTQFHLQLEKIKKKILEIYFTSINQKEGSKSEYEYIGDFSSLLSKYYLQMKRLKLVIQPDIQLGSSINPKTKIKYVKSIGFWINDAGEKERKYFKSVGRVDDFENGKDDVKAYSLAEKLTRELILKDYKERYPG